MDEDLYVAEIVNPNVAANTPIPLPRSPALAEIVSAALYDMGDYPASAAVAPLQLTVVTSIPSGGLAAGEIALVGTDQVQVGNATTDGFQVLRVVGKFLGQDPTPAPAFVGSQMIGNLR